jgi:hypothetical protein
MYLKEQLLMSRRKGRDIWGSVRITILPRRVRIAGADLGGCLGYTPPREFSVKQCRNSALNYRNTPWEGWIKGPLSGPLVMKCSI